MKKILLVIISFLLLSCAKNEPVMTRDAVNADHTPIHWIRFEQDAWVTAGIFAAVNGNWKDGSVLSFEPDLMLGQDKTWDLSTYFVDGRDEYIQFGGYVDSYDKGNSFVYDSNSMNIAHYRLKGTAFKVWFSFLGIEVHPGPTTGLKATCSTPVDSAAGLFYQVIISENGNQIRVWEFDTSTEGGEFVYSLKNGSSYSIVVKSYFDLAPPGELPAYVISQKTINITNVQGQPNRDGRLDITGCGTLGSNVTYTFDYNGGHWDSANPANVTG